MRKLNKTQARTFAAQVANGPFSYITFPLGEKVTILKWFFNEGEFFMLQKPASAFMKSVMRAELRYEIENIFEAFKPILNRMNRIELINFQAKLTALINSVDLRYVKESEYEESEI